MTSLPALIERLQNAMGPSRELDLSIARAVWPAGKFRTDDQPRREGTLPGRYTEKVNAADKLRPKGYTIRDCSENDSDKFRCVLSKRGEQHSFIAIAKTPAIALCIAALKALAQGG